MGPAEAQHAAESVGVAAMLGLNWKLFLAQLVNFSLVLVVVWRFVYRPLIKAMDERSGKIERGLKDAEESKVLREQAEAERQKLIREARVQAKEIMETAEADAKKRHEDGLAKVRTEVERVVNDGKLRLRDEQEKMIQEAREQVGDLVLVATERVLREKMTATKDRELVQRAVEKAQTEA